MNCENSRRNCELSRLKHALGRLNHGNSLQNRKHCRRNRDSSHFVGDSLRSFSDFSQHERRLFMRARHFAASSCLLDRFSGEHFCSKRSEQNKEGQESSSRNVLPRRASSVGANRTDEASILRCTYAGWRGLLQAGCANTRNVGLTFCEVERSFSFYVGAGVSCATHPATPRKNVLSRSERRHLLNPPIPSVGVPVTLRPRPVCRVRRRTSCVSPVVRRAW